MLPLCLTPHPVQSMSSVVVEMVDSTTMFLAGDSAGLWRQLDEMGYM